MKLFFVLFLSLAASVVAKENTSQILQVSGIGKMHIPTTLAEVHLGIELEGKNSAELQDLLAKKTNVVVNGLKPESVETTSFRVYPEYSQTSPPQIKGYRGKSEIKVSTSIENAGAIIEKAMGLGATEIINVDLVASDDAIQTARKEALRKACAEALALSNAVFDALKLEQQEIEGVVIQSGEVYPTPLRAKVMSFAAENEAAFESKQEVRGEVALKIRYKESVGSTN